MTEKTSIEITPAKGRPMLTWVGKRPLSYVTAFPAQHVETFDLRRDTDRVKDKEAWLDWPNTYPQGGLLFHGDNKEVLAHLLANGFRDKVMLVYIDPPFDSAADYVRRVSLRGVSGTAKLDGEGYTLGEQIQYADIWANDNYLQFMYERLLLIRELLADEGSLWLHCDWRQGYRLRHLLDEVLGQDSFVNEIAWKHTVLGGTHGRALSKAHETLLWYSKRGMHVLNQDCPDARVPYGDYIQKTIRQDEDGRWFYTRGRMSRQPSEREAAEKPFTVTYVDDPEKGALVNDLWDDQPAYRVYGDEDLGYPTQKNESLLRRIIGLCSRPDDIVMDCFIGSGTTAAVAQKLGRRWIGCDINKGAIQTTAKRLLEIIEDQAKTPSLLVDTADSPPKPAQSMLTVWRVNDYDLQIQHNEAVNLACEHIGIERTHTDVYFDGVFGRNLAKIIPFNHPLSPLDLDELRRELEARPDEDRNVTVVCLGKELAADAWLDDWNRLRKGDRAANRIDVIELRTDPRYGKFFEHKPASARVNVTREDGKLHIEIVDFISPTIIERLRQISGVLTPTIDDWRAMVDSVMIDPAYCGKELNVALADIPEKKSDFVLGTYTLPAPEGETVVAVKIVDMLGEEALAVQRV